MLDLVESVFLRNGIQSLRYDGSMSREAREAVLQRFRQPRGPRVILIRCVPPVRAPLQDADPDGAQHEVRRCGFEPYVCESYHQVRRLSAQGAEGRADCVE